MPDGSLIAPGKHLTRAVFAADPPSDDPFEFVLSDETLSRDGNIIVTAGWQLANFRKNPIALFGHRSDFFIGNWTNVRIEGQRLLARLEPMTAVSERLQEIQTAIRERVLRAVSVGWYGLEVEPIDDDPFGGVRFLKSELVEASVVGVGSNPNALSLARSLNLSRETIGLIFGEPAVRGRSMVGGFSGVPAVTSRSQATQTMSLSELIQGSEQRLVQLRDNLNTNIQNAGGVMDDAATQLTEEIENEQRSLENLKRAEKALGNQSDPAGAGAGNGTGTAIVPYTGAQRRQVPAFLQHKRKDVKPADYAFRAATVGLLAHITKQPREQILRERYGDDESTRIVTNMMLRAASVPATTTLTGWAVELVSEVVLDLLDVIVPDSVYRALASRGAKFTFGQNGVVTLPARSATPTIAGSFVAEGGAIPVRQAAFASVSLTPKKMAVISTFTREIMEHSTPQIEALIRQIMQEDTSATLDSILLDATVASTTRPAGLRYGVANTNIVTGGGVAAIVGDIKAMMQALATNKALRDPVWIMNPVDRVAALLATNADGEFIFRGELTQGTLGGFPVITSENVTSGMVLLVNAADFFSATGDEPRFDVSDQATLHMEDTSPTAIVSGGTAASGAVRSLFQTDSLAIRMVLPINWAMRRTGGVSWSESVNW